MKTWSRCLGRFKVDAFFFAGLETDEGVNLFRDVIVLDVRFDIGTGTREYLAMHRSFRPVPEGEVTPEYNAYFTHDSIFPTWVEIPPIG